MDQETMGFYITLYTVYTGQAQGPGKFGFHIMLCTVRPTQGQETIVYIVPIAVPVPVPVPCLFDNRHFLFMSSEMGCMVDQCYYSHMSTI